MLPNALIAVKAGSDWRLFDPASTYVPADMLPWRHEGIAALISDPNKPVFVTTPVSAPERSAIHRTATMKLSSDGTLEGDVRAEYVGHQGAEEKEQFDELADAEREAGLKESIQGRLGSTTEITNIKFANVTDPNAPVSYTYHVRVPAYAQPTGRRLFFQPGYFQKGISPMFTTEKRVHPIYFPYPWTEDQLVTIELPDGFDLDNPDSPADFPQRTFMTQDIEIGVSGDHKVVRYSRKTGYNVPILIFKADQYGPLKQLFDLYNSRDNHALSLRQSNRERQ